MEILIIGGGPAGISMAVEARFAGIPKDKVMVIEKTDRICWSIITQYPDNKLVTANYKGFTAIHHGIMRIGDISKSDSLSYFNNALFENDMNIRYNETVARIGLADDGKFDVVTDKGEYRAGICVVAIGILGKPNRPEYPLPRTMRSKIHFDLTAPIADSDVLVVGGGDTAAERAIYLSQQNNSVILSYRGSDFHRMHPDNRQALLSLETAEKITIFRNSIITGVERSKTGPRVAFAGHDQPMVFHHIVYCLGGSTPNDFLKGAGIEFEGETPVIKDGYETNIPGLFLAGDLTAGTSGGSINWAFKAAHESIKHIIESYLGDTAAGA